MAIFSIILFENLYGLNMYKPAFYTNVFQHIENLLANRHIVIRGDFNLIFGKKLYSMNFMHRKQ